MWGHPYSQKQRMWHIFWRPPAFSGKLLTHNYWKEQLTLPLYNKPDWHLFPKHLLTCFLYFPRYSLFYFFQDHPGLSCRQTSRISTGSSWTMRNSLISPKCQKYQSTKQNLKFFSKGIVFLQNTPNFISTSGDRLRIPVPKRSWWPIYSQYLGM